MTSFLRNVQSRCQMHCKRKLFFECIISNWTTCIQKKYHFDCFVSYAFWVFVVKNVILKFKIRHSPWINSESTSPLSIGFAEFVWIKVRKVIICKQKRTGRHQKENCNIFCKCIFLILYFETEVALINNPYLKAIIICYFTMTLSHFTISYTGEVEQSCSDFQNLKIVVNIVIQRW